MRVLAGGSGGYPEMFHGRGQSGLQRIEFLLTDGRVDERLVVEGALQ
ncbi:hypothetical protein [Mycobacterium sp.]|nr:hypothetical protein [Mycobacterium sp.]HXB84791.1 hypothetical protein [Mycobacterium sp.]